MRRRATLLALLAWGCGPGIPAHDGYPAGTKAPWEKPDALELDRLGEAEVDDVLSYPKRKRARWYAIDLPASGEMKVELSHGPLVIGKKRDDLDIAFEVLDRDHRVITRADKDEPDAGKEKKSRTLYELPPGRYFVHVFAQQRLDEAQFTLRLIFEAQATGGDSQFPADVAFLDHLPAVPPVDDAPPPRVAPTRRRPAPRPKKPPEEEVTSIRARIAGLTADGGGTGIRINRGESAGVQVGWRGNVVTKSGNRVPGGAFTVKRVSAGEAYAVVKASPDAVTAAKFVLLRPP